MDCWRKVSGYEQVPTLLNSNRRTVSGFGLGVVVALLVMAVVFLDFPCESFSNPLLHYNVSYGLSPQHSLLYSHYNSSVEGFADSEKNHQRNCSQLGEGNRVIHLKNCSQIEEREKIGNFGETTQLNGSRTAKKRDFNGDLSSGKAKQVGECDVFAGKWVKDETKPYYPAGSCAYVDEAFDCHRNKRPDFEYEKWRWKPDDCDIPSLNATDFLERLRGKRLVFVGDSLNRNMWESLVCILRHSVGNKSTVYEISGRREFRTQGFYAFRYEGYNCSVEFVRAPFLVQEWSVNGTNGTEEETLRLDLMDKKTLKYREADVIVFNTGHWWTHEKTSLGKDYYQEGDYVYPSLNVMEAYRKALTTLAKWVDENINSTKTWVFFRGFSITHFSGGRWNSGGQCHKETEPIYNNAYLKKYPPKMKVLESVLHKMKTHVTYLNISRMTDYRKDAHPSVYRKQFKSPEEFAAAEKSQDCSHWCLPGVPDTWNELLYASLLIKGF
ncbi:protein trichome birefringence-like 2 [Amborella trichopoda]|uniref:Uncharacterized protein n=1 Tax=Amborella trichopoda TaxID=13333 RepID=W1P591_AMBTC|nr:protein trichome birefringence-like 2 [Amborella trichopoda]ERN02736.1 hypothetical protein AMTR_s00085p00172090 [Amborella trichopoda]|eukprot:XP_006841061.1 protein trichome birefringence-like 2 [Amborella trichopoda]